MAIFGTKKQDKDTSKDVAAKKTDAEVTKGGTAGEKQATTSQSLWSLRRQHSLPEDILKRTRITEKTAILASTQHAYTFEIDPRYGKKDVERAFKAIYKKDPVKINILKVRGKKKQTRKGEGRTKGRTKAVVYLSKKETIDFV